MNLSQLIYSISKDVIVTMPGRREIRGTLVLGKEFNRQKRY